MADNLSPNFEVPSDKHGRHVDALAPSGGTLNVDTSNVANGGFLPGERDETLTRPTIIRVTATKNTRLRFSKGSSTADSTDMLFQAGTESMRLPKNTNYVSAMTDVPGESGKLSITVLQ